jgi:hypothetical protein
MTINFKKILYWTPRVLSILYICFISIFALDAFDEPQWLLALLIHLIPSYILIAFTIISWKKELLGGILFIIVGLVLLYITRFEGLIIALPAFVIGGFFILATRQNKTRVYIL